MGIAKAIPVVTSKVMIFFVIYSFFVNNLKHNQMSNDMTNEHKVLGIPIFVRLDSLLTMTPVLPSIAGGKRSSTSETAQHPATLLPHDGLFLTIIIDQNGGLYVRTQREENMLYIMQSQWAAVATLFPVDSILFAILYTSLNGMLVLGIYDIVREHGTELLNISLLERHARVQQYMQNNQSSAEITAHWVGYESACLSISSAQNSLPFRTKYTVRLGENKYTPVLQVDTLLQP